MIQSVQRISSPEKSLATISTAILSANAERELGGKGPTMSGTVESVGRRVGIAPVQSQRIRWYFNAVGVGSHRDSRHQSRLFAGISRIVSFNKRRLLTILFTHLARLVRRPADGHAPKTLNHAERHFQTIVGSLDAGVIVIGRNGHIESVNPAALRIFGITATDLPGHDTKNAPWPALYDADGRVLDHDYDTVLELLRARAPHTGTTVGVDRLNDGQRIWLSVTSQLINSENSRDAALMISVTDITKYHTTSQQLEYQATHDAMTGLPNRAHIVARISEHLNSGHLDVLSAVLFIDLDNFKTINDSLGHGVGDVVLQTAAHRLRTALRSSDIVGRIGGDEFVTLMLGHITNTELDDIAERLHTTLGEPVHINDVTLTIQASIGIVAIKYGDQRDGDQVLRDADTAMYAAKGAGGATSHYFSAYLACDQTTSLMAHSGHREPTLTPVAAALAITETRSAVTSSSSASSATRIVESIRSS